MLSPSEENLFNFRYTIFRQFYNMEAKLTDEEKATAKGIWKRSIDDPNITEKDPANICSWIYNNRDKVKEEMEEKDRQPIPA